MEKAKMIVLFNSKNYHSHLHKESAKSFGSIEKFCECLKMLIIHFCQCPYIAIATLLRHLDINFSDDLQNVSHSLVVQGVRSPF